MGSWKCLHFKDAIVFQDLGLANVLKPPPKETQWISFCLFFFFSENGFGQCLLEVLMLLVSMELSSV